MQLFYAPDINGNTFELPETESKHLARVLRKTIGDEIKIVDGQGTLLSGIIVDDNPKKVLVELTHSIEDYGKRENYIHIAIAPTKNMDRMEWFTEKATEIGIDRITPIICDHSERRNIKAERIVKRAISAMKQSNKAYLPVVDETMTMIQFLDKEWEGTKMIAHCEEDSKVDMMSIATSNSVLLIGPEGDFSPTEIEKAISQGFTAVSLGESRLRTETAGIVAVTLLNQV